MGFSTRHCSHLSSVRRTWWGLVGRFPMVGLVLGWNPAQGAPSLAAGETRGIFRCFSASPALQWRGAGSTLAMFWFSSQTFEFNVNIWSWCTTVSDLGLTHMRGSFEIKHFSLRRTFPEGAWQAPTQGRAAFPPGGQVLFPLCSSSSRCAVAVGSCIFLSPGAAPFATVEWMAMGKGSSSCRQRGKSSARHELCVAFHEPCRTPCSPR